MFPKTLIPLFFYYHLFKWYAELVSLIAVLPGAITPKYVNCQVDRDEVCMRGIKSLTRRGRCRACLDSVPWWPSQNLATAKSRYDQNWVIVDKFGLWPSQSYRTCQSLRAEMQNTYFFLVWVGVLGEGGGGGGWGGCSVALTVLPFMHSFT